MPHCGLVLANVMLWAIEPMWNHKWRQCNAMRGYADRRRDKIREYVSTDTLKSVYYSIFDSHLNYDNLVWSQNINTVKSLTIF